MQMKCCNKKLSLTNNVIENEYMKHMDIPAFKYWLRIHGYRLEWFGTGPKTIQSRLNQEKEINNHE